MIDQECENMWKKCEKNVFQQCISKKSEKMYFENVKILWKCEKLCKKTGKHIFQLFFSNLYQVEFTFISSLLKFLNSELQFFSKSY